MNKKHILALLKKEIRSSGFVICIICGMVFLLQPIFSVLMTNLFKSTRLEYSALLNISLNSGAFALFAPGLAVLPYSTSFSRHINSKFISFLLIRQSHKSYLLGNIFLNSILGGLSTSLPICILSLISIVLGKPYQKQNIPEGFQTLFFDTVFEDIEFQWGGILVLLICIVLAFFFGSLWANIGLCVSSFCKNKYVILSFPMIIYYLLSVLFYSTGNVRYSPLNMIYPIARGSIGIIPILVIQFFLNVAFCSLYYFKAKEELKSA